ncbi:MAG: molybdopterin-dependent oxidoreductase [Candidatus Latescibacterota bacterium]|nr:MAG: molybdopterin-dependent oxidoreductase [Candidatus Latescibacterota bacterium]
MKKFTTGCPRNCYSTCTFEVQIENGRIRAIEPHPANKATPEGPCLKGLSYVERVHSPDRILYPMIRRNDTAEFEQTSWNEALDRITERMCHYRDAYGPQSVMFYAGSGTKGLLNGVSLAFWRLFGGCTTTYGDLCWPAGLEATRLTLGENKHSVPWDIANAKLIVLWGKNSAETNIHQMLYINRALDSGATLVVVDPRRTESSERAQLLIQPRPGTDGAIALAVAKLLIENGSIDDGFIDKHVLGYDEFARAVEDMPPERAADVSSVPVEYIRKLARLIAETTPVTINTGFGLQRYTNSGQTMRAILALLILTGNIGKPGAGWIFANLQSHVFDAVKDPVAFYPPAEPDGVVRMSVSTARLGPDMLRMENPPLKMLWVERGNPITQNPETNQVLKAVRALDFRVVVDQFMTDTAREADVILPAKTMFEQTDVINAYWHPYIQLKPKAIDPPGGVKPETEIYYLLAQRLGIDAGQIAAHIPEPTEQGVRAFLEAKLNDIPGLSLEQLRKGPVIAPDHQEIAFSDFVFPTPSGKIELASDEANTRWGVGRVPVYSEPMESTHSEQREQRHKYPLYLMTPNTKNRIHSQFNNLKMIRDVSPGPFVAIHPADAAKRGIKNGVTVRVFNDRGSIEMPAQFDHGMRIGCVAITNGWWASEGGGVNFCSKARETDIAHGAAFHDNLVEVQII